MSSWKAELDVAVELARGAGELVLSKFGKVKRLTKTHVAASAEAVTEADRASQRLIVAGLRKAFPADGIVGEESDTGESITFDCPDPMGRVWVIDPIDGTNNFVGGLPAFAVCIGLLDKGYPVMGVVLDVTRDQIYTARKGGGVFLDKRRVQAAETPLDESSIFMVTANLRGKDGRVPGYAVKWIGQTTWKVRILGSAALEASAVAAGIAHGAITVNGKLWDVTAPAALVLEAGGVVTDLAGRPVFPFDLRHYQGAKVPFLAAAPKAHPVLLKDILDNP